LRVLGTGAGRRALPSRSVKLKTALLLVGCCLASIPYPNLPRPERPRGAAPAVDRKTPLETAAKPDSALAPIALVSPDGVSARRAPRPAPAQRPDRAAGVPFLATLNGSSPASTTPAEAPQAPLVDTAYAPTPVEPATPDGVAVIASNPIAKGTDENPPILLAEENRAPIDLQLRLAVAPAGPAVAGEQPAAAPPRIARYTARPAPAPPVAVELPGPPAQVTAKVAPIRDREIEKSARAPLRPVDIAQISDSDVRSPRVAQLNEPGLVAGGGRTLSQKIAAMQVTPLPPPRLRSSDRAKYLAEAPTRMTVRVGATAVGKVDFRMTEGRMIDVQLSGLLDLLANGYDRAEFTRLRNSAAADAYVSFDKLRAMGLNVRYDPVYDEVRIDG
jgi:hypothetical protein